MKKFLLCLLTLVFALSPISVFAYNDTDIVGHTIPQLTNKDANKVSTNLGSTVVAAIKAATSANIVIINGGALKGTIAPGAITYSEVKASLIPGYEVVKYDAVDGADIITAINEGYTPTPPNTKFPHVDGLVITVTSGAVSSIKYNGVEVSAGTKYSLATIRSISGGTDVYTPFDSLVPSVSYTVTPLEDVVSAYLTTQIPVGVTVADITAAETVSNLIKTVDITKVTPADKTKVNNIFTEYNKLTVDQKALVVGASSILLAQNSIEEQETLAKIESAIVKAEESKLKVDVDAAKTLIDNSLFSDTIDRDAMYARLDAIVLKTLPQTGENFYVVYGLIGLIVVLGATILVQRKHHLS